MTGAIRDDLKRCPFCGSPAQYSEFENCTGEMLCDVGCSNSYCLPSAYICEVPPDKAIHAWETRNQDDLIEALAAENRRMCEALENIGNLSLNGCIKVNTKYGKWIGTPDAYAREVMGMPWRTEDPDYSNEILGCFQND